MCAVRARFICLPSMICHIVVGPNMSSSIQASSIPLPSMELPIAHRAQSTVRNYPSLRMQFFVNSGLRDCNLRALRSISRVIKVFLFCPTTSVVMCCACFRMVRSVYHSCDGTWISGRVLICVRGLSLPDITEVHVYATQVVKNCEFACICAFILAHHL